MTPAIKKLRSDVAKLPKREFDKFVAWIYRLDTERDYKALADDVKGISPKDLMKELKKRASYLFKKPGKLNFLNLAGKEMADFYKEVRVKGCRFEDDADMLLAEWGVATDTEFRLAYTRQIMPPRPDGESEIWQLTVDTRYPLSDKLKRIKSGSRWFRSLRQLDDLNAFLYCSRVKQAVADMKPSRAVVCYQNLE
jgi:hypothetical protein